MSAPRTSWRASLPGAIALALLVAAPGCVVEQSGGVVYTSDDDGTLTVEWTLDDSFDPGACHDYDARTLELVVYEWDGSVAADLHVPCDEFTASINLPDGTYAMDATLLDRSGREVTTTLSLDDIDVYYGEETFIPIDFPVDSVR